MASDPAVILELAKAAAREIDLSAAIRKLVETNDPATLLAFETALEDAKANLPPPDTDKIPEELRILLHDALRAMDEGKAVNGEFERLSEAIGNLSKAKDAAISNTEPVSVAEFFPTVETSVDYLIEPILIRTGLTELHGEPKSGKSCFSLLLAICAATGHAIPGEFITLTGTRNVLYLAFEDGPRRLKRRTLDYLTGLGISDYPANLILWSKPDIDVGTPGGVSALRAAMVKFKIDITVIDTLSHVHRAEENDAGQMKTVMATLTRLARQTNSGIIYVHHSGKGSGAGEKARSAVYKGRGSSAIVAAADVVLDWGRPENNITQCEFISKDDDGQTWDVHYEPFDEGVRWNMTAQERTKRETKGSSLEIVKALIELESANPKGVSPLSIGERAGYSKRQTQRLLDSLVEQRKIGFYTTKNKTKLYKIVPHDPSTIVGP